MESTRCRIVVKSRFVASTLRFGDGSKMGQETKVALSAIFFLECRYKGDEIIIIFLLL